MILKLNISKVNKNRILFSVYELHSFETSSRELTAINVEGKNYENESYHI